MGKTMELARKQGLVKSRPFTSFLDKPPSSSKSTYNQKFTHFLILDFESTCWAKRPGPAQEIIEFPAVIYDAKKGKFEFHSVDI